MILSLHAITGAVLGSSAGNPLESSILGLISHYFCDFLPHFDYKIDKIMEGEWRTSGLEFFKILTDLVVLSAVVVFIIYKNPENILSILLGTFFALLPDGLLFIHYIFNKNLLNSLIGRFLLSHYKFHYSVHSKIYSVNAASISVQLFLILFLAVMIFG